jgi:hypothetical protein
MRKRINSEHVKLPDDSKRQSATRLWGERGTIAAEERPCSRWRKASTPRLTAWVWLSRQCPCWTACTEDSAPSRAGAADDDDDDDADCAPLLMAGVERYR